MDNTDQIMNEREAAMKFTKLLEAHENEWVILSPDKTRIIASGKTFAEISAYAEQGIAMHVPSFEIAFVGTASSLWRY